MGFTVNLSLSLPNLLRCLITVYSTVGISGRREALDFSTIEGKLIDVVHTLRHPFYPSPPSNALLIYALSPAAAKKDCFGFVWVIFCNHASRRQQELLAFPFDMQSLDTEK